MTNIYRLIRLAAPDHLLNGYLTREREIAPCWAIILALAWETGLQASDMPALARGIGEIEQADLENLFGYAQRLFDAETSSRQARRRRRSCIDALTSK